MATELGTGYLTMVTDTSQIPGQLAQAFGQGGQRAGRQGGQAAAGGILDSLKGKGGMIGEVLGVAFAVAGVSAAGLFVKSLQNGMEREKILDLNQARLGVDDATMNKIGFAAGRAYAGSFGESVEANIDTARRAIQSGLLDPNATAQDTQKVISQLSGISSLMGEEIPAVSRAAGQAIKTGIAGSATEAFDLFAAAERNGLNVSEDFLDTVTEYGTQFRKLGLSGPEAIGLVNQAVKGGARDVDVAADAIKEFSIRVADGSKSTREAFQTLGFDADDLTKRFAQGGSTARAATGELLTKIREIEDPVKRNQIALALFGTQFEDLGAALGNFNLDTAAASLGNVAGAAENAVGKMGEGAAGSIEGAKRSIEVSTDAISSALAKAFGPELARVADWVTQHQPEILDFLAKMVDGAFATADAFLAFSSMSLRAFASFADGLAPLIEGTLKPLGKITEVIGKITHDQGLQDMGSTLSNLGNTMHTAADGANTLADGIDNKARPGLDRMRDSVASNIAETTLASRVFQALGDTVVSLPDGHTVTLQDNTPETTARLEALGLKVTTLPNGSVTVTANTAEGQRMMDAFIATNTGRPIEFVGTVTQLDITGAVTNNPALQTTHVPGGRFATGGLFRGKGGPTDDANTIRISNSEHLAYITRAQAASPATIPFLDAINAGWVPPAELLHGMVPGFAEGGLASARATSYARSHNGEPYVYGGLDCSGYLSGIYNQLTGKSARFTTGADFSQYGFVPGLDPGGFSIGTNGGSGVNGHMAGTLLGTNVESDGTNGIQFGGSADGAAAFPKTWHLPRELWAPPETDNPSGGSSPGGLGSGGSGSLGGGASGGVPGGAASGGASGAGAFGGVQVPEGVTPVWVVNGMGGTSTPTVAPSESFAPQASTTPAQDLTAKANETAMGFLNANLDQALGDLGMRRSGGAIQNLVGAIYDAMAKAAADAVQRGSYQQERNLMRTTGRPF